MKKRPISHVTDTKGAQLLRSVLPDEWIVRVYQPDYGIDYAIEVFDKLNDGYVTLGEHFFVQLKSHSEVKWITKKVCARFNVEKVPLTTNKNETCKLRVIAEPLELQEFQLARSMGPAAPLVLVVADTTKSEVYWVCLNDFVDKVLVPESGTDYSNQSSHTVHLPEFNRIDLSEASLIPLRFIARRAKLYAAFNRFRYQRHEISYAIDRYECMADQGSADPDLLRLANHFLEAVLAYDFWRTTYAWPALELTHMSVKGTANRISRLIGGESLESLYGDYIKNSRVPEHSHESYLDFLLVSEVRSTFDSLANLGNMFEEICREWFLPTYLGTLSEKHAIR